MVYTSIVQSSISILSLSPKFYSYTKTPYQLPPALPFSPLIPVVKLQVAPTRGFCTICCYKNNSRQESDKKEAGLKWPILKRWDVPWNWQTISLTSLACGLSFVLTGLIEAAAIPYTGLKIEELSLDEKAEILFVDQSIATAVVLGVLYSLTKSFSPLPDDIYRYDLREPFNLQKGWLLWAGIGLGGALGAIALTGVVMSFVSGETPQRETDALVRLLPLIGSSSISTACLVGITGVLAPILEETVFRGFFMVSLTKWLPTPLAVLTSAAVFAFAHLTPGEFPQLFVLGTALGFSYAQTRNLLTPITIHAFWNSGVILLLTFLQLQGYDIKELLQAS
ncbi:CAAX amino terminal protease family protein [Forsythia ovata]|uniref:CAAX amino terminal protease family protein n=1 Tax=Forsythia ovata TaxID=205694 RepID=A0ABD1TC49_9LAMI